MRVDVGLRIELPNNAYRKPSQNTVEVEKRRIDLDDVDEASFEPLVPRRSERIGKQARKVLHSKTGDIIMWPFSVSQPYEGRASQSIQLLRYKTIQPLNEDWREPRPGGHHCYLQQQYR